MGGGEFFMKTAAPALLSLMRSFAAGPGRPACTRSCVAMDNLMDGLGTKRRQGVRVSTSPRITFMRPGSPGGAVAAALRNLCRSLVPGGELTMVVWAQARREPLASCGPELCVREIAGGRGRGLRPADRPRGPFSMAGPDMVKAP